jgi:hypothetical protein
MTRINNTGVRLCEHTVIYIDNKNTCCCYDKILLHLILNIP